MENPISYQPVQPRQLKSRGHYRVYLGLMCLVALLISSYWVWRIGESSWVYVYEEAEMGIHLSLLYFFFFECTYIFWLKNKIGRTLQVFGDHVSIQAGKSLDQVAFAEVESWSNPFGSQFSLRMKSGERHSFNSSVERIDYVWEGFAKARPDLVPPTEYEALRVKLVQDDHHQKRKEWFFRHKVVDVFNWVILPLVFLGVAHLIQSKSVIIHQQGLYFFRLFMCTLVILLATNFLWSLLSKKLIFDRKLRAQMGQKPADKLRDLEFEGVVLERAKIFQTLTACFLFTLLLRNDVNMFSVTKVRGEFRDFVLPEGATVLVDNRYNCTECAYEVTEGDLVVFGRGNVGQVMAREGEMVGEVSRDSEGRAIASDNVQAVPEDHVAIRSSNGRDIMFVRLVDLLGKVER